MAQVRGNDEYGRVWTIYEANRRDSKSSHSEHLAPGWLCFRRDDGHLVRVPRGEYPADWDSRSAGDLLSMIGRGPIADRAD